MRIAIFLVWIGLCALPNSIFGQQSDPNINNISKNDAFDGWINLFTGDIKSGWRVTNRANWQVNQRGELTVSEGEVGLLRTTTQYDDFTLRLEFKATPDTNSGVFIRTSPNPANPKKDCFEINIAPASNPFPTGSIVGRVKGRELKHFDYSKWHLMEVHCENEFLSVKIDGIETAKFGSDGSEAESEEERPFLPLGKGYIGLQLNSGPVSFRNIFLKPVGLKSIFNGKNLDGWNSYPEMKSRFAVKDGVLNVRDGSGQLETKGRYDNFVLQVKVKTNAPRLNSGIFFRCIPGEKMNGYESQIHNGFLEGDRNRPEDCGTGGFFRRKDATTVVANDQEWFIKTLIVNGPHMATWVNGVPVCEWTDKRKADKNPRRGLRLEPGTIMIQGHDPTTDIDFKDIYIKSIDSRKVGR